MLILNTSYMFKFYSFALLNQAHKIVPNLAVNPLVNTLK